MGTISSSFGSKELQCFETRSRLCGFFWLLILLLFFLLFQFIGLLFVILTLILLTFPISHECSPFQITRCGLKLHEDEQR
jgi:hypothetical protein